MLQTAAPSHHSNVSVPSLSMEQQKILADLRGWYCWEMFGELFECEPRVTRRLRVLRGLANYYLQQYAENAEDGGSPFDRAVVESIDEARASTDLNLPFGLFYAALFNHMEMRATRAR